VKVRLRLFYLFRQVACRTKFAKFREDANGLEEHLDSSYITN
jgi:hypothetical protein